MRPLNPGTEVAFQKIKQYCDYQERSHDEVKQKLYSYGLYPAEVDELMAKLIELNLLNEERFAIAFAGGKFRIKNWGKQRIIQELKAKRVSSYCIQSALAQISDEDYKATFEKLVLRKWESLRKEKNQFTKKQKLRQYLLYKGYENKMIMEYINREKES